MRYAFALYVGLAVLVAASVGVASLQQRSLAGGFATGANKHSVTLLIPANDAVIHRLNAKDAVTRQVIAGQKTLMEAAAWFHYINAVTNAEGAGIPSGDARQSEGEGACRQVIQWVEATAASDPSGRTAAVGRQLQTELMEALRNDGAIRLPDLP